MENHMTSYNDFKTLMCDSDKGWHHGYHRFYYPILKEYESKPVRLLEIGVEDGKSMKIWETYFKNANHIYGIGYKNYQTKDIEYVKDNMTLFMGDQSSNEFLHKMISLSNGNFDIIIDDGSHVPSHIITSFNALWNTIKPGGYYIIEDVETSYWSKQSSIYGYSLRNEPSTVEYFKNMVDEVNNEFIKGKTSSSIGSISFMYNMIIIRKVSNEDSPFLNRVYRHRIAL